jgi:hypothetical protein
VVSFSEISYNAHALNPATERFKENPLKCEYGSSVLAAYCSAHRLVAYGEEVFLQPENPVNRLWTIWARIYGAAVSHTHESRYIHSSDNVNR